MWTSRVGIDIGRVRRVWTVERAQRGPAPVCQDQVTPAGPWPTIVGPHTVPAPVAPWQLAQSRFHRNSPSTEPGEADGSWALAPGPLSTCQHTAATSTNSARTSVVRTSRRENPDRDGEATAPPCIGFAGPRVRRAVPATMDTALTLVEATGGRHPGDPGHRRVPLRVGRGTDPSVCDGRPTAVLPSLAQDPPAPSAPSAAVSVPGAATVHPPRGPP